MLLRSVLVRSMLLRSHRCPAADYRSSCCGHAQIDAAQIAPMLEGELCPHVLSMLRSVLPRSQRCPWSVAPVLEDRLYALPARPSPSLREYNSYNIARRKKTSVIVHWSSLRPRYLKRPPLGIEYELYLRRGGDSRPDGTYRHPLEHGCDLSAIDLNSWGSNPGRV